MDSEKLLLQLADRVRDLEIRLQLTEEQISVLKNKPKRVVKPKKCGMIKELEHPHLEKYLTKVPEDTQHIWIEIVGSARLTQDELLKAVAWLMANPQKNPRNQWGRFFTGWINRSRNRSQPSNKTEARKVVPFLPPSWGNSDEPA